MLYKDSHHDRMNTMPMRVPSWRSYIFRTQHEFAMIGGKADLNTFHYFGDETWFSQYLQATTRRKSHKSADIIPRLIGRRL